MHGGQAKSPSGPELGPGSRTLPTVSAWPNAICGCTCICQDLLSKCLAISELCACCMADLPPGNFVLDDLEPI